MAEVRKTAVEVEAALQVAEKRKTQERLSKRTAEREEAESLKTSEETSGTGTQTDETEIHSTPHPKTFEEIVESGTPEEKAYCLIYDYDMRKVFGQNAGKLTKKQKQALFDNYDTIEDRELFAAYVELYSDLSTYQEKLSFVFKQYQIEISLLANLLQKWEMLDKQAALLTILLHEEQEKKQPKSPETFLKDINSMAGNKDVSFALDGDRVVADIMQEEGLYTQIKRQATKVAQHTRIVKAYVEVVENFISKGKFWLFQPMRMEFTIENFKEGRFARSLIDKKFFRSELNYKKIDQGLPVTEEEEILAIVPDYIEEETDPNAFDYATKGLAHIRNGKTL